MSESEGLESMIRGRLGRALHFLPPDDWLVLGWALAIKILLFIFGAKAFQVLENKRVPGGGLGWLEIWNRWDAVHFLRLAEFGYTASDKFKAWFYPLFPWSIRVVAWLTGNYLVSAIIVSAIALLASAVLLRRLVQIDFSPEVALRTVWFLLIFPTSYFLHAGFTEGLFLALVLGSLLASRIDRWWLAGALGALAWMTRANGLVLVPTLAVEAVHQFSLEKRWRWQWLWICLVPLGFAVYLLNNWFAAGSAFAFWDLRKQVFYTSFSWPWVGIQSAIGNLHRTANQAEIVGAQELLFILLSLACAITSWFKLRPLYATWITGNWLLIASATFLESTPRYALTMFPIYMIFALWAKNRFWNGVITAWSLLFLALLTSLFVRGWWAF
jgi:Gpi18-like mannosyltransferase